jgi:hypothetical protein
VDGVHDIDGHELSVQTMLRNRKPLQKLQLSATLLLYIRTPMGVFWQANSQGIYSDKLWVA